MLAWVSIIHTKNCTDVFSSLCNSLRIWCALATPWRLIQPLLVLQRWLLRWLISCEEELAFLILAGSRTWIQKLVFIILPFQRKQPCTENPARTTMMPRVAYLLAPPSKLPLKVVPISRFHWVYFCFWYLCGGIMSWNFLILPLVSPMLRILPWFMVYLLAGLS